MPETLLAAIVGVAGALFGVWLGGRQQREAMQLQIDSAAKETERQRLFDLKRNIFLPAARGLGDVTRAISSLSHDDVDLPKISKDLGDGMAAIGALSLAAGNHIVDVTSEFTRASSKVYFALLLKRRPLDSVRIDLGIANQQIQNRLDEQSGLVEMLKQMNLQGIVDDSRFARIDQQLNFVHKNLEDLFEERNRLQAESEGLQSELVTSLGSHMKPLAMLSTKAVARMRQELGLPSREDLFVEQASQNFDEVAKTLDGFIDELKKSG